MIHISTISLQKLPQSERGLRSLILPTGHGASKVYKGKEQVVPWGLKDLLNDIKVRASPLSALVRVNRTTRTSSVRARIF
jgi:hypothetical protein